MKKYSGLLAALGVSLAFVSFSAMAQDEFYEGSDDAGSDDAGSSDGSSAYGGGLGSGDRRAYIAPMFSYTLADKDRNTKDGIGGTISLGKRFTSGLTLELTATYSQLDSEADNQTVKLTGVGAAAMIFPVRSLPGLYGILALHHGQVENHPTSPNASTGFGYRTTIFDPGVGYLFPLADYLGGFDAYLRTEARYRMDAHNRRVLGVGGQKHFYESVANVGILIPLGDVPVIEVPEAPPEEIAVVETAPVDSDGDGLSDDMDQCPDTPAGVPVNDQGCEADTDGDGIVDRLDTCPDTPTGVAVNEQGCTAVVDADGDGIPDDQDQCPDTPAGTVIDERGCAPEPGCRAPAPGEPISLEGCATGDAIVLRGVTFDTNSDRLTANAKVILNQVADALNARADIKVEIGGHTDSVGADAYNQKLSERRARSVFDYLVARGIDPSRMQSRGYGETQPVDTNETNEGREVNRRVELKVQEGGTP